MTRFINTKKWTFLKEGADDFRNGVPPCIDNDIFSKKNTAVHPVLTGSKKTAKKPAKKTTDQSDDSSRLTLMQRQRIKNVEAIEYILKQHPLALYPHLEECLPPEVFEDVVSILDPEMTLMSEGDRESAIEKCVGDQPATYPSPMKQDEMCENQTQENEQGKLKNPYRWLPEMDEIDKKDKKSVAEQQKNFLKTEDEEHIKNVTQQFCDWVASLGGDSNNIEESTITSLFASGYETKPALSVPIHVVELASVPQELRMTAANAPTLPPQTAAKQQKQEFGKPASCEPDCSKYQYGAWYLEPKLWKKRVAGEPLRDPNDTKDHEVSEAKQRSLDLDHELAPMNGVKLFMDFVDHKDTRRPEFLSHVSEILEQQNEEQMHMEAEHAKLKTPGTKTIGKK